MTKKISMRGTRRAGVVLVAGVLAVTACGSDSNDADVVDTTAAEEAVEEEAAEEPGTIVDVAVGAGSFETLVAAVTAAGLVETLSGEGPFTVFAPTDEAFAALPEGLVEALLLPENVDALTAILTYHVLGAEVPSSDVAPGAVATVQGEEITLSVDGETVMVNDATVVAVDVEASNGVIHVIDSVLVPPSIDPTALLADDDMSDMDEESMDEEAPAEEAVEEEAAEEPGTIVDVAVGAGSFETLVAAVTAAGLVETLSGEGPFTVFAPTDEAFAALPEGLVEALLLPENVDALTAILTYHVLGAEVPSSDVAPGAVATVQGEEITLSVDGETVMVNDATVVAVDVEASNGVIHVIDSVLVPPSIDPTALLAG
ncbi:MAG: fasciclin domain-containing protein [Ilumatobacter sp.]|uniref:fasciclin domain-containing protein n=1 Tax=Ilumatobacter sp. TaxID=1967498 RepID=UPI00391A52E5